MIAQNILSFKAALICSFVGALILHYFFDVKRVSSESMSNSICKGDYVFVKNVKPENINHGKIIAFFDKDQTYIKRVVALQGDTVRINNGDLIVNEIIESKVPACRTLPHTPDADYWPQDYFTKPGARAITIPAQHVFILGDNRDKSKDSRVLGPLPMSNITGEVVFTLPVGKWKSSCEQICVN